MLPLPPPPLEYGLYPCENVENYVLLLKCPLEAGWMMKRQLRCVSVRGYLIKKKN